MRLNFYTIDVFTNKIFGGNPLAVFLDADKLSSIQMQSIAREINYSETAFVLKPQNKKNTAKVRIFTPKNELPFAGHPNVGTSFLLLKKINLIPGEFNKSEMWFEIKAGLVRILPKINKENIILGTSIEAPQRLKLSEKVSLSIISECIELNENQIYVKNFEPIIASVGLDFVIAEVESRKVLSSARCNQIAFEKANQKFDFGDDFFSLMIFCRGKKNEIHARVFAPLSGIIEDPATGSACGALGGLLASLEKEKSGKFNYKIFQGYEIGRPSKLEINVSKVNNITKKPWIFGESVIVSEGKFYL